MTKQDKLAWAHERISDHLAAIAGLFTSPVKLTIVVRHPAHPDGSRDVTVSDDETELAIAALRRLADKQET